MKIKKVILTVTIIAVLILAIPITLMCFAFALPAQYDLSFYGGMKIKTDRLNSVAEKKIVVIGGSSVAFGIRTDLMEKELGMKVVNFGLYANLGTKYMLDVAKNSVKDGDIVVIAPEQNSQSLSLYFNGEAVWYSADGNFALLNKVASSDREELFKSFLKFVSGKFGYWRKGEKPCPSGVYNAKSFNEYGDIRYERKNNVLPGGYDAGTPIYFRNETISKDFIEYVNNYSVDLEENGARVYFAFSPMNRAAVADDSAQILSYTKMLEQNLSCKLLGNPETRIMDSEWFYDSNFHLNDVGSVVYTKQIIQDIKAELGVFTPINIALPDKPVTKSDNDDVSVVVNEEFSKIAKIFVLSSAGVNAKEIDGKGTVFGGSWTIDGLTEYGKTLAEIEIPDTIIGLPVKNISAGAFSGNPAVEKITFGKNIESVGVGAFDNCPALKGIYITSLDPNSFHPSKNILDGADNCFIYVPKQVYGSEYLIDYFWGALVAKLKSY